MKTAVIFFLALTLAYTSHLRGDPSTLFVLSCSALAANIEPIKN